jgi:hypothetical protein
LEAAVNDPSSLDPELADILEPDESIQYRARATDALLAVTDRRVVIAAPSRSAAILPINELRRIQFDIERDRPATLVLVPETSRLEVQVLSIPPEEYEATSQALVAIGLALYQGERGRS